MNNLTVHSLLGSALGDSFYTDPLSTDIPDGARFSAQERANYLNRAIETIYGDVVKALMSMSRKEALNIANRLMPSYIKRSTGLNNPNGSFPIKATMAVDNNVLYVFEASGLSNIPMTTKVTTPRDGVITLKVLGDASSMIDIRMGIRPDVILVPLHTINGRLSVEIWDENELLLPSFDITISYLCEPKKIGIGIDEEIELDEMHLQRLIALASLYAWDDTQDLDNAQILASQISPLYTNPGSQYANPIQQPYYSVKQ